jgi:hypothetical protein
LSRNSHSRAGYTIYDPGQDYGNLYRALVLEFSPRDGLVLRNSCPGRDDDVGPRMTIVPPDRWESWTLGCACALLRPGPVLLLKLRRLAQAQGFGHHLPSLPSAKLLALASRWPLLLAPTSRRSIPAHQFASTSHQSSWTIQQVVQQFAHGYCLPIQQLKHQL